MVNRSALCLATAVAVTPGAVPAEENRTIAPEEIRTLAPVEIIGDIEQARTLPGSGAVVGTAQLELEGTTDINQALKTVPGIYVREEDGEGLRPNIGIRGATAERSSNITLMEDGVLIAPAPYSNPAAYYTPTFKRMSRVEVLKGAPLLRHGPQTTGGVVNLISTPIPDSRAGMLEATLDERGSSDLHIHFGDRTGAWSYLLETVQRNGDGFKDIDRSNRDTGFDIEDYVGKLRWDGEHNALEFKAQYSEETSNASYLGLTDTDFDRDPNRRYGLSAIDQMNNRHAGFSLTHEFDWTDQIRSTTTAYRNDFKRNWFKLQGGSRFIDAANRGDATAQGILDGSIDESGLTFRNNSREYESYGIQTHFDLDLGAHKLGIGARLHEDEMDRFQPEDIFDQVNGSLVFQETKQPTGGNNRFETGEALSFWVVDEWQATDRLRVNLALRYEDVETSRTQYADPERNTIDGKRSNNSDEWLPGASFTYEVADRWQVLAGGHRGFSPLGGGAKASEDPETSDNWEAGVRYFGDHFFAEAIGFYSDFSDKVENCSVGAPCSDGSTSGTFTTGEAVIRGLELQLSSQFSAGVFEVPVDVTYTYTDAEVSSDNPVSGLRDGDRLKDVPRNTFSARVGLNHPNGWDNSLTIKYIDSMCDVAGCNRTADAFNETESLTVVDLASRYPLGANTDVFVRVENLFDTQRIVSRSPDGARPNKPQTLSVGLRHYF